jgi:hypothetical protein
MQLIHAATRLRLHAPERAFARMNIAHPSAVAGPGIAPFPSQNCAIARRRTGAFMRHPVAFLRHGGAFLRRLSHRAPA